MNDTICAIATATGPGAIGIVRLSGPAAFDIAASAFRPRSGRTVATLRSHSFCLGEVIDGPVALDEALLAAMRAPRSYTGEDVIELHCHGGPAALRAVLALVQRLGARLARPGEFTRRAFEAGRIDLAQAEAVLDLVQATSEAGLKAASRRLSGALSERVRALRADLLQAQALLAAGIDFPEDTADTSAAVLDAALRARDGLDRLLDTARLGRICRSGAIVALAGRPNVGKSSLFNRLLDEPRAIVTSEPGTTRDVIEEGLLVDGLPVRLLDAAGLREPSGRPEQLGVAHARRAIGRADLVLLVLDRSGPLEPDDRLAAAAVGDAPGLLVLNKADLDARLDRAEAQRLLPSAACLETSAESGLGIRELRTAIAAALTLGGPQAPEDALVASARQVECLTRSKTRLEAFLAALRANVPPEAAELDLRDAQAALDDLLGSVTTEEILDRVFGQFCIGK